MWLRGFDTHGRFVQFAPPPPGAKSWSGNFPHRRLPPAVTPTEQDRNHSRHETPLLEPMRQDLGPPSLFDKRAFGPGRGPDIGLRARGDGQLLEPGLGISEQPPPGCRKLPLLRRPPLGAPFFRVLPPRPLTHLPDHRCELRPGCGRNLLVERRPCRAPTPTP